MEPNDTDRIDREYNARASIPDHPEIFARWASRSSDVRSALGPRTDLAYGRGTLRKLDLFSCGRPKAPLLIFIHGGYWRSLDKSDFSFLAPPFLESGTHVALLNYRLAPAAAITDIVMDVLCGCAWLWRHARDLGVDRERLFVAGHSAGGHLAAMMLAADWSAYRHDLPDLMLKGALAVSGLFDLAPLVNARFLQADLRLDEQTAEKASPVTYTPRRALPLYTAVGGQESSEFKRQNRLIANAWPHCVAGHLEIEGRHHLDVIEELGQPSSTLFDAARRMMALD